MKKPNVAIKSKEVIPEDHEEAIRQDEQIRQMVESHINIFSEAKTKKENGKLVPDFNGMVEFPKFGFESEKDMLLNLHKKALSTEKLKAIITETFEYFEYDEEELQKIIYFMYRTLWG